MNIDRLSKYIITSLFLAPYLLIAQNQPVRTSLLEKTDLLEMTQWVDSVFATMTIDDKAGQVIMVMAAGDNTEANKAKLKKLVEKQRIGGIIFSKGNPKNQAELTNLCQQNATIPLIVAMDGEWGLSMRLDNTTRFPRNMMLGAIQEDSLIYYYGREVARQSHEMGIHVNFAPAIDVNSNPDNPVIGTRSFGENPERVSRLGILYSKGLEDGRIMATAKHFPGHGDTATDSHKELPLVEHSRERLDTVELRPFRDYINAGLSGMMIGHLNVPVLDNSGLPSSLSKVITTDLLQDELGFSGLVFTDGLAMKGVSSQPDMSVNALKAGNDILVGPIYPEREFEAIKAAAANDSVFAQILDTRCRNILAYKYILNVNNTKQVNTKNLLSRLNTSYAEWLVRKLNEKAMTLLRNEENTLPVKHLDKKKIAAISIGAPAGNTFHETLKLYANVTCYTVPDAAALLKLKPSLAKFNTIILSVHANKAFSSDAIQSVIDGKNSILTFFTTPYRMSTFAKAIKKSDAVVMAYESTSPAQEFAAQAIFGGNAMNGKLPVTVEGVFDEGEGLETEKIRLSYNQPEEASIASDRLNGIEAIVNEGISKKAYPGCQVLIAKDGVVIYNRSFGKFEYGGKRTVQNSDIYDIASMTKATGTVPAIMKLYDEKKITLQAPLSKYIPALKGTDKASITVREALLHETGLTSFIPYYMPAIDKNSYAGRLFGRQRSEVYTAMLDNNTWGRIDYRFKANLISTTPKAGYPLQIADNLYASKIYEDSIIALIADSKLRSKDYRYSCLNFILLKEVVEAEAKTDLNTFLQNNFFEKLGSVTTTFNPLKKFPRENIVPTEKDDFLRKQLIQGYVHDEGAAFMGGISGNAGLFSNANDLAKLYQMWLNKGVYGGEELLSKETCRLFTTAKSAKSRRGLGFDKPEFRGTKSSPCSPQTPINTYGHTGFTGTCFWVDPDNNLIYIFLSNRVYEKRTNKGLMELNIRSRIQEEIYNALRN